jgi:hypothetical protein
MCSCNLDRITVLFLSKGEGKLSSRRHIQVRLHYLEQLVKEGLIQVVWIKSSENPADFLTKPELSKIAFIKHRDLLMAVVPRHQSNNSSSDDSAASSGATESGRGVVS